MSVNFQEFLESSKEMVKENKEISYRNATSRAYYAAFHEAKRVSKYSSHQVTTKNMGTHQKLIEKLKGHSGTTQQDLNIRQIGIILSQCKKQRINADYKIHSPYTRVDANSTILQVNELIKLTSALP